MPDLAELQAALDDFNRRYDELAAAGIPWDEALRRIVNDARATHGLPPFPEEGR